jgi:hypothetical protein
VEVILDGRPHGRQVDARPVIIEDDLKEAAVGANWEPTGERQGQAPELFVTCS